MESPEEYCRFSATSKFRCETEVSLSISLSRLEEGLSERLGVGLGARQIVSVVISSGACKLDAALELILVEVVVLEFIRAGRSLKEFINSQKRQDYLTEKCL